MRCSMCCHLNSIQTLFYFLLLLTLVWVSLSFSSCCSAEFQISWPGRKFLIFGLLLSAELNMCRCTLQLYPAH